MSIFQRIRRRLSGNREQPEPIRGDWPEPEERQGPRTEDGRYWDDLSAEEKDHLNHTVWDVQAWSSHTSQDRDIL